VNKWDNKSNLYSYDGCKMRKNILYYSNYDIPIYSVMDTPEIFNINDDIVCGFYFVISDSYFPLRGNGWYSKPMIDYCIEQNIITKKQITHKLLPSLFIPAGYFKEYINYSYKHYDNENEDLNKFIKLIINSFIGHCYIKEQKKHDFLYVNNINDAAYLSLTEGYEPNLIYDKEDRNINLYRLSKTEVTKSEEDAQTVYLQVLDIEAIELHKLSKLIKNNGGLILEYNTDCVTASFNNKPLNIDNYFWDDENKVQKYRMQETRLLKSEKMPRYRRTDIYNIPEYNMFNYEEPTDNNFEELINKIIDNNEGLLNDSIAGSGKTYLNKLLKETLQKRNKNVVCLAPTNKAAFLLNGMTIHKWYLSYKSIFNKYLKTIDYIIIDEISMMHEIFYKLFLDIKLKAPHIKLILSGDFRQLQPVKDRVNDCDYKNSYILKFLCDFNKLELSKCRRSDDKLFLLSKDLNNLDINKYDNKIRLLNICYYNKTRHEVN